MLKIIGLSALFLLLNFYSIFSQTDLIPQSAIDSLKNNSQQDTLSFYQKKFNGLNSKIDSTEIAELYFKLGRFCYNNYYSELSEQLFQLSENFFTNNNNSEIRVENLNYLGIIQSELGKYSLSTINHKSALRYSRLLKNNKFASRALGKLAINQYFIDELDSALYYFDKAIEIALKDDDKNSLAILYNNSAIVCDEKSDYNLAWEKYSKSLEIVTSLNDTSKISTCYNNLAIILETQGKYLQASEYYNKAISFAEAIQNLEAVAMYKANYAYILEIQNLLSEALKIQYESYNTHKNLKIDFKIANSQQNIARVYGKMDSIDQALRFYDKSNEIYESLGRLSGIAINSINMAPLLQSREQYSDAISLYLRAESILKNSGDIKNLAACYTNLSGCYLSLKKYSLAEKYALKAYKLSEELGTLKIKADVVGVLADTYSAKKQYKLAYEYSSINKTLNDSLLNEEKIREISQLESKYQYAKVITENETKNRILESKLEVESVQNIFLLTVVILAIIIIIVLTIFYSNNKRKNIDLMKRNLELLNRCDTCLTDNSSRNRENEDKYSSSKLSKEEAERVKLGLADLMKNENIWKNSKLTVTEVSKQLETNSTYLSQIINTEFGQNFTNFMNEYRIREAERLIIDGYQDKLTIEALAEDCGFNSRATFNKAFKKFTGLTPTKFRELLNEEENYKILHFQKN